MKKLIRLKEVIAVTGMKRSLIYKEMDEGRFPKPIKVGPRAIAWVVDEIEQWIEQKIEQRGEVR